MLVLATALTLALAGPTAPPKPRPSDGPKDLVEKAYTAAEQKRYCDAIPLFLSLHERAPQPKHLYRAAEVAYAAGDRHLALDLYRSVLESYPRFEKKTTVQERVRTLTELVKTQGPGTTCPEPAKVCGDWIVRPGEQCDDGNLIDGDGCDHNCTLSTCGNGIVTKPEQCDDGNLLDGDGCDGNCTPSVCGNGVVAGNEECDDGNTVDADGCDHDCTRSRCGNGVVAGAEECDDGNTANGDGCDRNCTRTRCGNGAQDPHEECDDGNDIDGDGCDRGCKATRCGNGIVTAGEECDDGNTVDGDGCSSRCTTGNGPPPPPPPAGKKAAADASTGAHESKIVPGALTFAGSVLLVSGTVATLFGLSPVFDHLTVSSKIADAEKLSASDPQGALTSARNLQAQDADANARWQQSGLTVVTTGAACLLVGGVAAATGWFLWNSPADHVEAPADPSAEERVP